MDPLLYPIVNIDDHGIIHIELGSGVTALKHLRDANAKHRELNKKPCPVMIFSDAGNKISLTTEAIEYGSSKEVTDIVTAFALVTQSFMQRYLVKIFMTFHRPPIPVRIFSNKKDALEWLSDCDGAIHQTQQTK